MRTRVFFVINLYAFFTRHALYKLGVQKRQSGPSQAAMLILRLVRSILHPRVAMPRAKNIRIATDSFACIDCVLHRIHVQWLCTYTVYRDRKRRCWISRAMFVRTANSLVHASATKVEALQIHANVNSQRAPRTILCSERYFKDRTSPPMFFRETAANDLRKRESFCSQGE